MRTVPAEMAAIDMSAAGGPEVLAAVRRPVPQPASGEVLIRVAAAGVNGPDLMQRKGLYPAPPGASDLLGLEVAGEIVALGAGVTGWAVGDEVTALTNGGGYAEYCAVDARHCLPVPNGVSAARRGRAARDLLHGVEQHLHGRRPQGGRDAPRARRRRRHRHDGDPARQGVRRQGHRHRQPGGALRSVPRSRRRPGRRLQGGGFRRGRAQGGRRERHPRHRRRPQYRAQHEGRLARCAHRPARLRARLQGRDQHDAGHAEAPHLYRLDAAHAPARVQGAHRRRAQGQGLAEDRERPDPGRDAPDLSLGAGGGGACA